jgi:1,2-dihydroxy-3-keto-5-methylthiopentene dioxygenase
MAIVRIPNENKTISDFSKVKAYLKEKGIVYEKWQDKNVDISNMNSEGILGLYFEEIKKLKESGNYTTADVINMSKTTTNLDQMLNKFNKEHWHNEDEVRFTIEGSGIFHIHPHDSEVFSIEVSSGDLISVPKGFLHWFDLCGDKHIVAIRLFQDKSGWTPYYSESTLEKNFQPVCFGPQYIPIK